MANCGEYCPNYLGNLGYVSSKLLEMIYGGNILNVAIPDPPVDMTLCPCGVLTPSHVFDCDDWIAIRNELVKLTDPTMDTAGILTTLCETLDCILKNVDMNYGLKAQFERFKCLCQSLTARIEGIRCNDSCDDIIGDLLCLLIQLLTKLISAVSKAATLVYYADCVSDTTDCCRKRIVVFFECMTCDFVNDLCELEKLSNELNAILIAFIAVDMQNCTPCGTAKCAPVKQRPMCPPNMMHGGYHGQKPPYGYGHKPGGCGCGCNK